MRPNPAPALAFAAALALAGAGLAQQAPPNPFLAPLPPPPPLEGTPPQLATPERPNVPTAPTSFAPYPLDPLVGTVEAEPLPRTGLAPVTPRLAGLLPRPAPPEQAAQQVAAAEEPLGDAPDGPVATLPRDSAPRAPAATPQLVAVLTGRYPLAIIDYAAQQHRLSLGDELPNGMRVLEIEPTRVTLEGESGTVSVTLP